MKNGAIGPESHLTKAIPRCKRYNKTMPTKKHALEINCKTCSTRFRIWIPEELLKWWGQGEEIRCIKCGASFMVTKSEGIVVVKTKAEFNEEKWRSEEDARKKADEIEKKEEAKKKTIEKKRKTEEETKKKEEETLMKRAEEKVRKKQEEAKKKKEAEEAKKPKPPPAGKTIIFVEPDADSVKRAKEAVVGAGYGFVSVSSGEDALKKIEKGDFDVIVTNLHLRGPSDPASKLDSDDFLKLVNSGIRNAIPAIVISGKEMVDELSQDPKWFDLRVKGFIQKGNPFWPDELKDKIKEVVKRI